MNLYEQRSPWEQNWERRCSDALAAVTAPADQIRQIRPGFTMNGAQPLFLPKFGYPLKQQRELGMRQIIDVPRFYQDRRFDISGGPGSFQGSERNVNQNMAW